MEIYRFGQGILVIDLQCVHQLLSRQYAHFRDERVHIVIAIAIFGDHPGIGHQSTQTVIQILAAFPQCVVAQDHSIGFVIDILAYCGNLLVLAVGLFDQIAAAIIGISSLGLPAIVGALHNLVQVVEDVVHRFIALSRFIGQIPQAIIGIAAVIIAIVLVDIGDSMQRIIGISVLHSGFAGAVAPHVFIGHVAARIILIDVLLLLHVLLTGVDVGYPQQLSDGVILILLHPAVRVLHTDYAAHAVILITGGAAIALRHRRQIVHQVVGKLYRSIIRIGQRSLVPVSIIGILHHIAFVVRNTLQLTEQVILKGIDPCPVLHPHQIAHGIINIIYLFTAIIIDMCDHIKGVIGKFCYHRVGVHLIDQIAVAIVFVFRDIAQRVGLFGRQAAAIIFISCDLPLIHAVLGVHAVKGCLSQVPHGIILKMGRIA